MRKASIATSCVAELAAIPSASAPASSRLEAGSTLAIRSTNSSINSCVAKIQLRLCPSRPTSGSFTRSTSGAQRKLIAYTVATLPSRPISARLMPASASQPLRLLPIKTKGKPLEQPIRKIHSRRISR
jgi:hypothetical protein